MEHLILSCRKFAGLCGVSPAAISKAGAKGTLYKDPVTGKYDISHDDNYYYYKAKTEERGETAELQFFSQKPTKTKAVKKSTVKKTATTNLKTTKKSTTPGENQQPDVRRDYEIQKIKFDSKLKELAYEKELGRVVLRDNIQFVWNKIYKSASYFGDFGQKYSGEWAAALGISDPEKILALQKIVDRDTELFIADFTETVASEI